MTDHGWFADVTDDRSVGLKFRWQPFFQDYGSCLPLPLWFSSKADCEDYIRRELVGAGWLDDTDADSAPLSATETARTPPVGGSGCTEPAQGLSDGDCASTHLIADGSATTSCCGRTPFELPTHPDRLTQDPAEVTCPGPSEPAQEAP